MHDNTRWERVIMQLVRDNKTLAINFQPVRAWVRLGPLRRRRGRGVGSFECLIEVMMMQSEFKNEALTDFSRAENAAAMRAALAKVQGELGREYPLVIGGERIKTGRTFDSLNPARKTEVVGRLQKATEELARRAVETADETFKSWSRTLPQQRAELLFRVATLLRERRHEFSAWMVYEVAKTWAEADGDTAEAIDFCDFYAREMLRYAGPQPLVRVEGEENELSYIPLGVGVV